MEFKKYQHLERFGTSEVENINLGECYIFPKLDGTNASLWVDEDGNLQAGSRNRQLTLESDNAGFYNWAIKQEKFKKFFEDFPDVILYGEWLVPHSLKTYREDAWRNFYVFDVATRNDEDLTYYHYNVYKNALEQFEIDYLSPISVIKNPDYDMLINQLPKNTYLIKDGEGAGEGIVIKNYDFKNKYGRQTWAKIVTTEFKEKHTKEMGSSILEAKQMVEEIIADKYVTEALCEKVFAKITLEEEWSSKRIPQLLNTVYYDVVREDCWNFVKEYKNPTINFGTLQHFVFNKVKKHLNRLF